MSSSNGAGSAPGIAVVGDGHLARLVALAARDHGSPARLISPTDLASLMSEPGTASARARALLDGARCVVLATEHCPADVLRLVARHVTVSPAPDHVALTQDRAAEREWLDDLGIHTVEHRRVTSASQLLDVLREFGGEAYLKPCRRSEESGRPVYVRRSEHAVQAWRQLGSTPLLVEEVASIELELAVLVARSASGQVVVYPPTMVQRQSTELRWAVTPAPIPPEIARRAQETARRVAEHLDLVGVLTLELFWLNDGRLVTNEMVLGPHLAHAGDDAAFRSGQCDQIIRLALGQPLAPVVSLRPTAAAPITGAMWSSGHAPDFERLRGLSGVRVSFYGGRAPHHGRVLGHVSASSDTPEAAVSLLLSAQRLAASEADRGRVNRTAAAGPATRSASPRGE